MKTLTVLAILFASTICQAQEWYDNPTQVEWVVDFKANNQTVQSGVVVPPPTLNILKREIPLQGWDRIRALRIETLVNTALEKIHFDFDSYALDEKALSIVDEIVFTLQQNQDVGLILAGHTDAMGSEAYNVILSKNRAEAVAAALEAKGIAPDRLRTYHYGETQLIEQTQKKSRTNRRVEAEVFDSLEN